ncbi:MAG: type IV toxin-antitoxin system AbiEi family antitoxin [Candidatus Woesebacteria bacterium]|jgi:hypothetical protein
MKEQELITQLEQWLPEALPGFKISSLRTIAKTASESRVDILASLEIPATNKQLQLAIAANNTSRLFSLLGEAYSAKTFAQVTGAVPVVAAIFLGKRVREALKKEGVGYLDLAGNFYLNIPGVYAERIIDKNPFSSTPPLKNIFSPISSRITRALLEDPKKEWSISDLSTTTGVSLGQTYNVLKAMSDEAFVRKVDDRWQLSNPTALLDAWKEFYPKYQSRKYTFFSYAPNAVPSMVRDAAERTKLPYALGFFSGADMVAPFIRGMNKVQFYTDQESVEKWRDALQLKEVQSGGNVEIYVPYDEGVFYGKQLLPPGAEDTPVVSNIQLYMDLFNNPARGEEAAEYLRKERIGF